MDTNALDTIGFKRRFTISMRMFRQGWRLRKDALIGFFTGAIIEVASSIALIYAGAKLSALLADFASGGNPQNIWLWFWLTILMGITTGLGFFMMNYNKRILYFSFVRWSINGFLGALTKIELKEFYDEDTRNLINKVGSAYSWQMSNLSEINLDLSYGILRFLAITAVVSQIAWWIVPIIAVFLLPTLISEAKLAKVQWFVWDQKGDTRHIFWGLEYILRKAQGQMEVRSLQADKYVLNKIDSMNDSFYNTQESRFKQARTGVLGSQLLENIGPAIAGIVVLKQFLSKLISLERYFFLTGALIRIGGALNAIFGSLTRMQEPIQLANSYFHLIENIPVAKDINDAIKLESKKAPEIVFENVSFTYPKQENPVFENLNLVIESGEHVALVGENGSGKTTLIKLLLRFYVPDSGKILINGEDLQSLSLESWYNQIATLFQTFNQYPLSIKENIEIGRATEKPDPKLLDEAADFGGVSSLVKKYTHGWDTVLESSFKKGVEPSGGQWQRVALSRAFYRQANILILDEPTSAIDAKAEYDIFNKIFEHYKQRTTLIVSHRFSTVRRADRIIVLENGQIIEQGSHKDLMSDKSGLYYDLFTKQAEGYRD